MNFSKELEKFNIFLSDEQQEKFEKYYSILMEVNSYMNLTAITDKEEVFIKHFLDSLSLATVIDLNRPFTLCDVGSGAGFPAIPLAIVSNTIEVTIVDSLNKRIQFLNELIAQLNLKNVSPLHYRAEEYVKIAREKFDFVTARAVARFNILAELCLPLTKVGGYFIAMKGQIEEELKEAINGIHILGGVVEKVISFELPENMGKRTIVIIKKVKECSSKYPRQFSKIKEKPL